MYEMFLDTPKSFETLVETSTFYSWAYPIFIVIWSGFYY